MILILVAISAIILGVILSIVGLKFDFLGDVVVAMIGTIVLIIGGAAGLIVGYKIAYNQLPSAQYKLQLDYEETYNTLITALKADKNNIIILADKVAEYNIKVKEHYARLEDPWVNWLEPTINAELKTINLEDYLN
jgi:hypothetical protein